MMAACLAACGQGKAESDPLLYRVSDGQGCTVYLLGTIHMGRPDFYPLGTAAEAAYQAAEVLAVEADLLSQSAADTARYSAALMYGPGDECRRHLAPETYQLGLQRLGRSEGLLNRMRPAAWYSLAETAVFAELGCSQEWGVDSVLLRRAHDEGKPVEELEGGDAQIGILLSIPDEVMDGEICRLLSDPDQARADMENALRAWQAGDADALLAAALPSSDTPAYRLYTEAVYARRNALFAQRVTEYLAKGRTALVAVGAAHLLGQDGLAQRLADAGYRVERLPNGQET